MEVQRLADKLSKARTPGLIVEELRQTPAGCDWLIERWKELDWRSTSKRIGTTNVAQWRSISWERLEPCGNSRSTCPPTPRSPRNALALRQIDELRNDRDEEFDELERERVAEGRFWDDRPEASRLRSYDEKNTKRFHKLLDHFIKRMSSPAKKRADEPIDERQDAEEPPTYSVVRARIVMIQAGLFPVPAGSSLKVDPALVGLSAEQLAERIAPRGVHSAELLDLVRQAIAHANAKQ